MIGRLFTVVAVALTIMAFLAHPVNLYVVFDMFWSGFKRKMGNRFPFWFERQMLLSILFRSFWVVLTCKNEKIHILILQQN